MGSMDELETSVIERIKRLMATRGMTQTDLANALNMKQYAVSRLLQGSPFPSLSRLKKIAEALDVSLYYLIGVQEPSYRELSPKGAKVADAYQNVDPAIQTVIDRILMID